MSTSVVKQLAFSELSETEKEKYVEFLLQNEIEFEEDESHQEYVARVKIKNSSRVAHERSTNKENNPNNNNKKRTTSVKPSSPKKKITSPASHNKSTSRKDPFVLATARTTRRNQLEPLKYTPSERSPTPKKDLFDLIDQCEIKKPLMKTPEDSAKRSRSLNVTADKRKRTEESSRSPMSKRGETDGLLPQALEFFRTFVNVADLHEVASKHRPRKMNMDGLTKIIEEVFSIRFNKETALLKAGMQRQSEYDSKEAQLSSFPGFFVEYLRERMKSKTLFSHQSLSIIYSLFIWKKKSFEAEIFSRFLSGEYDNEDLTFFLFVRSIVEKEFNLMFMQRAISAVTTLLTQNQCLKVIESVYGKDERQLVGRLFKKVKEHMAWEREKNLDGGSGKLNIYSFLKIAMEDYHQSRQDFISKSMNESSQYTENSIKMEKPSNGNQFALQDITNQFAKRTSVSTDRSEDNIFSTQDAFGSDRLISVPSLKEKMNSIDFSSCEKVNADNFSFRNYEIEKTPNILLQQIQKVQILNERPTFMTISDQMTGTSMQSESNNAPPSKSNSTQSISTNKSSSSSSKISSQRGSRENLSTLMEMCLVFMMKRVDEFVDTMLFENKDTKSEKDQILKYHIEELLEKKFKSLLKALFSFEKVKWLNLLMINEPTPKQLQNIEELQKELRGLMKTKMEDITEEKIGLFAKKIFTTPELSTQIGKLIVEFTMSEEAGDDEGI